MTFASDIKEINFQPAGPNATGIMAPIMRASGHVLYACASLADGGYTVPGEEILSELQHAKDHLATTAETANGAPISAAAKKNVALFVSAVTSAHAEFTGWGTRDRATNLKNLANRAAAIAAYFDAELAGIDADPGSSL